MRYNHRLDHSQVLSYEHGRHPKMKMKAAEECFIPLAPGVAFLGGSGE